jgi:hypothetical protein
MLLERSFDSAKFDPKPTQLDLLIPAAQEFDRAVGSVPDAIARPVQT